MTDLIAQPDGETCPDPERVCTIAAREGGTRSRVDIPGSRCPPAALFLDAACTERDFVRQGRDHVSEFAAMTMMHAFSHDAAMALEVNASDPAELVADDPQGGFDHQCRFGLFAQDRADVALEFEQQALPLLARDVSSDAAIADEFAGCVVHRATADRLMMNLALKVDLTQFDVFE